MPEVTSELPMYVAVAFSGITLLYTLGEKLFGGGNALAAKFHKLDKETTAANTVLRAELMAKIDTHESNYRVGIDAITANIHALQLGLLEFRAKMAEEYVAKGGLDDIKADMRRGFDSVERRMGELQDMILWAQPPQNGQPGPHKPSR